MDAMTERSAVYWSREKGVMDLTGCRGIVIFAEELNVVSRTAPTRRYL